MEYYISLPVPEMSSFAEDDSPQQRTHFRADWIHARPSLDKPRAAGGLPTTALGPTRSRLGSRQRGKSHSRTARLFGHWLGPLSRIGVGFSPRFDRRSDRGQHRPWRHDLARAWESYRVAWRSLVEAMGKAKEFTQTGQRALFGRIRKRLVPWHGTIRQVGRIMRENLGWFLKVAPIYQELSKS